MTGHTPSKSWLLSRTAQALTVESELALGLWLASGFYFAWATRAALAYFAVLAVASGHLLVEGVDCCGCLGRLPVSPWFTFVFNLAAIGALAACPADGRPAVTFGSRPVLAVALGGLLLFAGVYVAVAAAEKTVASSVDLGDDGALVVLDVENWSGKPLPVVRHVVGPAVGEGEWVVVLHQHDCAKCRELIAALEARPGGTRVALVEVPAFDGSMGVAKPEWSKAFAVGRLDGRRRWVVETPQVMRLEGGVVTRTGLGVRDVTGREAKE